jgi:uncharacterized BrkB/YihY/UPF0761 family membrane protein
VVEVARSLHHRAHSLLCMMLVLIMVKGCVCLLALCLCALRFPSGVVAQRVMEYFCFPFSPLFFLFYFLFFFLLFIVTKTTKKKQKKQKQKVPSSKVEVSVLLIFFHETLFAFCLKKMSK